MEPADVVASYTRAILTDGEVVRLVRAGDPATYMVHALIRDFTTEEMAGGVQQDRRKAFILPADVDTCRFPLPFRLDQDRIVWNNGASTSAITRDGARRHRGVLVAYEFEIEGG